MNAQFSSMLQVLTRSNTEVYVRILPELNSNLEYFKILEDGKSIYVRYWQDFAKGKENPIPSYQLFETNGTFYNVPQSYIFDSVTGNGLFDRLIYGNNAMIMSYGQTGSGKTLTTSGLESTYEDRGLLPRITEKLFEMKRQLTEKFKICIKFAYVETNRNYMVDLLSDDDTTYDMNTYKHIKPIKMRDYNHGLKLIFKAEARKTVRLKGNYKSNMANSIATFSIFTKGHNTAVSEGTLHVIDLAGIDTVGNYSCDHKTGYEVGNGNLVKSQIEQLILVINENFSKSAELKQRLCIINHYLRKVLNSNSLIRIIAHVRVQREDIKLCTSMLRLGCSIKGMVPKKLSRFLETSLDVQYQVVADELKALKKEMDLNAMLCNEDMSCNLSDERLEYIQRLAMEYLDGKNNEMVLLSTTDTVLVMKVIKNVYRKIMEKNNELTSKVNLLQKDPKSLKSLKHIDTMSVTSKPSRKNQSNSTVKRATMKKASSKYSSKSKMDAKHVAELPHDNFSYHSVKSKSSRLASKKRSRPSGVSGEQVKPDSEETLSTSQKVPDEIPSYATAWNMYIRNHGGRYSEIQYNVNLFNSELETLTRTYNKEVQALEELNNIANLRKNELNHAIMIKDIDTNPQTREDLREFQSHCIELANTANKNVVEQKEKILKLQAEMRLHIDYKAKLQEEVTKKFDEFCLQHFKVLIPGITASSVEVVLEEIVDKADYGYDKYAYDKFSETQSVRNENMTNECRNNELFNNLKAYMRREAARMARKKLNKKKWILSFKLDKC